MKFIPNESGLPTLELTRRNLEILLAKLDDPESVCMLGDPDGTIWVKAVENEIHYSDRPAGAMYMPSSGETI